VTVAFPPARCRIGSGLHGGPVLLRLNGVLASSRSTAPPPPRRRGLWVHCRLDI
jgi:hypothetical protein